MRAIVGLFENRDDVRRALNELRLAGLPDERVVVLEREEDIPEIPLVESELSPKGEHRERPSGSKPADSTAAGLPAAEIFLYEDALRQGRIVVAAFAEEPEQDDRIRVALSEAGAGSLEAARTQWWAGLRTAEAERYTRSARSFDQDELFYRLGFEAALNARTRCKEYDQVLSEMDHELEKVKEQHPEAEAEVEKPFIAGYERGRAYYQSFCNKAATQHS